MATVTMDVTELDKMRGDIKILGDENTKLNKELIEVRADKRIMTIIKKPKSVDVLLNWESLKDYIGQRRASGSEKFTAILEPADSYYSTYFSGNTLANCIRIQNSTFEFKEETSFTNMDDVKEQITRQLNEGLVQELAQLKVANTNVQRTIKELEIEKAKALKDQRTVHEDKVLELSKKHADEVRDLKDQLNGKVEEDKIRELGNDLNLYRQLIIEYNKKGWLKRLFNITTPKESNILRALNL